MILDINGNAVEQFDKQDCPVGTLLLSHMVGCLIEKDDVVYKLTLNFGSTSYQKRIPYHEFNDEVLKTQWTELLTQAFVNHEIGKSQRGSIAVIAKSQES